jgi:hypothetical protein
VLTVNYFIQTFNNKGKFFIRYSCDFFTETFYRKSANLADFDPGFFGKIYRSALIRSPSFKSSYFFISIFYLLLN